MFWVRLRYNSGKDIDANLMDLAQERCMCTRSNVYTKLGCTSPNQNFRFIALNLLDYSSPIELITATKKLVLYGFGSTDGAAPRASHTFEGSLFLKSE